jgi:HD-GYP domain-containing protein (c-di-GMP phosphodiesterase class II)
MVMSNLLEPIFKKINLVAYEQTDEEKLILLSAIPTHLIDILSLSAEDSNTETFFVASPYLDNFVECARDYWNDPQEEDYRSGPWIEPGPNKEQIALEAKSIIVDGRKILIVEDLGIRYLEQVAQLQTARENLLTNEQLELEVQRRTTDIVEREEQIALCLLAAAGYRDQETGAHIRRIGMYAAVVAENIGWSADDVHRIRIAAPMHDIGKIGIPDSVLLKPGALTESEFDVMKKHPTIGAKMLANTGIPMMNMASDIANCHHERWDGSGYPNGLKATDIPVSARITAIVDIYDALVHERVYKPAFTEERALEIMGDLSGKHIDPNLYKTFLSLLPEMRSIREAIREAPRIEQ